MKQLLFSFFILLLSFFFLRFSSPVIYACGLCEEEYTTQSCACSDEVCLSSREQCAGENCATRRGCGWECADDDCRIRERVCWEAYECWPNCWEVCTQSICYNSYCWDTGTGCRYVGCSSASSGSESGTGGGSGSESRVTPTPQIPCSNESNCGENQNVYCAENNCQGGTSCWCGPNRSAGEETPPPSTGAGNCSSAASCGGTAPCPIGLSGSWYCNSGQCQSLCGASSGGESGSGGGATPTPAPPAGCTPSATTCDACTLSCGSGTQNCQNGCTNWNQFCNTQACCTDIAPDLVTLSSPSNNSTLGNLSVTFSWAGISSWGNACSGSGNSYKVYADTNANPITLVCSSTQDTPTCSATLNDQTAYNWKVVADNGALQTSSPVWTFNLKQPVIRGTFYEDTNENGCYNSSSGEQPAVTPNSINVAVNGNAAYCVKTDSTYTCTIPGSNTPGQTTVANLSTTGYSPPYTAQTNCASGENGSCAVNNCSLSLAPGDNVSVNIGYTIEQWFQTNSCSIYSGGLITSNIPSNAQNYDTGAAVSKYLILGDAGPVLTNSGTQNDFGSTGGSASFSNTQEINYPSVSIQDYNFFKQKVATRGKQIGSGGALTLTAGKIIDGAVSYPITNNSVWDITGDLSVSDGLSLNAINSAIIVSGNITINGNFTPVNSGFAFINQGNISVNPAVTQINGIFLSDGQFSSGITVNQGLKVVGSVAAKNGFILGRKWQNYKPAEYFVCDASAFINLVPVLGLSSHTWTEIAP